MKYNNEPTIIFLSNLELEEPDYLHDSLVKNPPLSDFSLEDVIVFYYDDVMDWHRIFSSDIFNNISEILHNNLSERLSMWYPGEFAAIQLEDSKIKCLEAVKQFKKNKTIPSTELKRIVLKFEKMLIKTLNSEFSVCFNF